MFRPDLYPILAVTNRKLCQGDFLHQIEKIADFGVGGIILREKDLDENAYKALALQVLSICEAKGVPCILHSFVEAAKELGVQRIHLSLTDFRKKAGELKGFSQVGVSVHSPKEAGEAERLGASYVTAGHIFATECKKGVLPRGLEFLEKTVSEVSIPVFAIGGITGENAQLAMKAGAKGVCVMSGMMR